MIAVHRRADLVAHVGEELAFRDRPFFRAAFGDLQLLHELCEAFRVLLLFPLRDFELARVAPELGVGALAIA